MWCLQWAALSNLMFPGAVKSSAFQPLIVLKSHSSNVSQFSPQAGTAYRMTEHMFPKLLKFPPLKHWSVLRLHHRICVSQGFSRRSTIKLR